MLSIMQSYQTTFLPFFPNNIKELRITQQQQHLCLYRALKSKSIKQEIIKRDYIHHMPIKEKKVK
jgi:hypothetical protein